MTTSEIIGVGLGLFAALGTSVSGWVSLNNKITTSQHTSQRNKEDIEKYRKESKEDISELRSEVSKDISDIKSAVDDVKGYVRDLVNKFMSN